VGVYTQNLKLTTENTSQQQIPDAQQIFSQFNQLFCSASKLQAEVQLAHQQLDGFGIKSDNELSARVNTALCEWQMELEQFERMSRLGSIGRCDAERQHALEDKIQRLTEEVYSLREHAAYSC